MKHSWAKSGLDFLEGPAKLGAVVLAAVADNKAGLLSKHHGKKEQVTACAGMHAGYGRVGENAEEEEELRRKHEEE